MTQQENLTERATGQKFVKEWTDCMNKGQTDLWKAWQANLKDATSFFSTEPSK
jgi:hypothetical protein